ncbi:hypothetical protein SALBM311S_06856 [Streptomyces alboniger]
MDTHHSPAAPAGARCPMFDGTFTADPQQIYDRVRAHGPAGPVELAPGVDATLVVEHETALGAAESLPVRP